MLIDYYLLDREDTVDEASARGIEKSLFIDETISIIVQGIANALKETRFYDCDDSSFEEAKKRAYYLKKCIEDNDVYRLFYD